MRLPLSYPGHSFNEQLQYLEQWAHLPSGALQSREEELSILLLTGQGEKTFIQKLKEIFPKAWEWPEYEALGEDKKRFYSQDKRIDMLSYLYDKLRHQQMAFFRFEQLKKVTILRPIWQRIGRCGVKTLWHDDPFWKSENAPWNCLKVACNCEVDSLSCFELKRYLEEGCAVGDEAAHDLLRV